MCVQSTSFERRIRFNIFMHLQDSSPCGKRCCVCFETIAPLKKKRVVNKTQRRVLIQQCWSEDYNSQFRHMKSTPHRQTRQSDLNSTSSPPEKTPNWQVLLSIELKLLFSSVSWTAYRSREDEVRKGSYS